MPTQSNAKQYVIMTLLVYKYTEHIKIPSHRPMLAGKIQNISQDSVATCFRYDGIFNNDFVINLLRSLEVKKH